MNKTQKYPNSSTWGNFPLPVRCRPPWDQACSSISRTPLAKGTSLSSSSKLTFPNTSVVPWCPAQHWPIDTLDVIVDMVELHLASWNHGLSPNFKKCWKSMQSTQGQAINHSSSTQSREEIRTEKESRCWLHLTAVADAQFSLWHK